MYCDTRLGGKPRWFLTPPEDWNMRIPDEIRDCVVFLGKRVMRVGGVQEDIWGGTGFFVVVPSEMLPNQRVYTYLVTAKHVVDALEKEYGDTVLRVNTKDGGSGTAIISSNDHWYFHPEPDRVDVAVTPVDLSGQQIDQRYIPAEMFLTDEAIKSNSLGVGDEVFMTGLFSHVTGKERSIPIVRMGNVAMMPNDPVPVSYGAGEMEAYLIEARSIGGLSGSPVFVRDTFNTYANAASVPHYLMGLMHGHWKVPAGDINIAPIGDLAGTNEPINMGIAIVVPAKKIMEVLTMPTLRARRAKMDEALRSENLPTMDSAIPEEHSPKTPAKPVSLYPMDEEEALKRLLRVPPPDKGKKP
jgi:hypothetical protein